MSTPRPGAQRTTSPQRQRVLGLRADGLSVGAIARATGLHHSTVTRHLERRVLPPAGSHATAERARDHLAVCYRCAWCCGVTPLAGPDAARVCGHCGQPEPVT